MQKTSAAAHTERVILIILALALPTLSLLPLGGLYLWDRGYLLTWAIGALMCVALVYAIQFWMLRSPITPETVIPPAGGDPSWTANEKAAWADVRTLAVTVDLSSVDSSDAAFALAVKTIGLVAHRMHPEVRDPEWNFTLPEALAISERVSRRVSRFIIETVPFGDRMTVSQFLAVYRTRRFIDVADKAYDVWRIVRLINPATAVTHEARERLTKALFSWGKDHVTRRVVETYVEEVGRAAIDLYSGRLRLAGAAKPAAEPHILDNDAMPTKKSAVKQAGSALGRLIRGIARRGTGGNGP